MKINVNGEWRDIDDGLVVSDLISLIGIEDPRGVAFAIDDEVVPRSEWETSRLSDGQRVEIVRAVQGG